MRFKKFDINRLRPTPKEMKILRDLILPFVSKTAFLTLSNYFCQLNITINLKSN
jgi:hypothetical protein